MGRQQRAAVHGEVPVGSPELAPKAPSTKRAFDRRPKGPPLAILLLGGDSTQGGKQMALRRGCPQALRCQVFGSWLKERLEKRKPRRLPAPVDFLRHAAGIYPECLVQS